MKTFWSILGGIAVLALFLAVPVRAEFASLSDADLDGISGKAAATNAANFDNAGGLTEFISGDANVQVGYYQWNDDHTGDVSKQKAANYFDSGAIGTAGLSNQAQQNVVSNINAITWGATGNGNLVAGAVSAATFTNMDYATMVVGGF
jgi:hypothetical protein